MKQNTKKLVMTALFGAIICIATMIVKIPTPTKGYINLGDAFVLLSGFILGGGMGGLAAAIGSALADVFSGYIVYAPATFIIKGLMAIVAGVIYKNSSQKSLFVVISGIIAEIIMIAGYFVFEFTFIGYGFGAVSGIIGNVFQGIAGIVISTVLLPVLKRINNN